MGCYVQQSRHFTANRFKVLTMKYLMVAILVVVTAFDNAAIAENKGTCPPGPPLSSQKNLAPLYVGATSVTAVVLAVISDTGHVCSARLLQKADKEVATEVTNVIREWHLGPATKDGRGVPIVVRIEVNVRRDWSGKIVVSSTSSSSKPVSIQSASGIDIQR
jgi:hypothetical protein